VTNADLFSLLKTYMNDKLSGIEKNLNDTTQDLARKVKKSENTLKFKGNQVQPESHSCYKSYLTLIYAMLIVMGFSIVVISLISL
jgi:hypothetical protein